MKSIQKIYLGNFKANLRHRLDALVLLTHHGKLIHRQFKKQKSNEPWQARYKQRLSLSLVVLSIIALFINIILPATTARAEATLSWSNNADFAFNKATGKCQPTTIDKLVISGSKYTDATCAAAAGESDLTLTPDISEMLNVTAIATSTSYTMALKNDGTVWAWGNNDYGQLGDNTRNQRNIPVQVKDAAGTGYLTGITGIATGPYHSLALKNDGTVWAWGYNGNGQLGDNTTNQRSLPVQVKDSTGVGYLTGVTAISAREYHSLAQKDDGIVWGWGNNTDGQLGYRQASVNVIRLPQSVVGRIQKEALSNVTAVAAGQNYSLAIKNDGTVWAWGNNNYGQLGDSTANQRNLPVQVKDAAGTGFLTGITAVAAGTSHSLALKNDGTVWAWGSNNNGQLGDDSTTGRYLPVQVKDAAGTGFLTGITAITTGETHSMALKNDGTVWTWGNNNYGQLGDNTTNQRNLPAQVKDAAGTGFLTGITAVAASSIRSYAIGSAGTVWAWGNNSYGQFGDNTTTSRNLPVQVKDAAGTGFLTGITAVATGPYHTLALKNDGTVWAWGYNGWGNLGDGSYNNHLIPYQVKDAAGTGFLTGITAIAVGQYHSLALKNDGTVWAWGYNSSGRLGDNTMIDHTLPVQVKDSAGTGFLTGITAIAVGDSHSLSLKNDNTIFGWGVGGYGQLGIGEVIQAQPLPGQVISSITYLTGFLQTGSLSGLVVDAGQGKKTKWYSVNWNTNNLPAGASVTFNVRTSSDGSDWSSWSSDFTQNTAGSNSGTADISTLPLSRYIELKTTLSTTDKSVTPKLNDFSLAYMKDITPPITNASNIKLSRIQNAAAIDQDGWIDTPTPYASWDDGADDTNGSGLLGYCLYLGTDNTADFSQTKGILGNSPLDTGGKCQYAVATNHIDLSLPGSLSAALAVANNPYHLLIKAIDNSGNLYSGAATSFSFKYDNVAPTNPLFISAPSQFVSDKNVTLTWPTTGDQSANDADSQIAGLQYRIGSEGTWYGDTHNGQQDLTDVLANDGSYQMDQTVDYPLLHEGNNIIYFRTLDHAGNISTSYITAIVKINTSSPSSPLNVTATPTSNNTNSFAFSWHVPTSFVGVAAGLTYCYTVNALPSANNCTFTNPGQTALTADAYATQPGENIFYVVAKDEAGNINYATYGSATFTANTPAPGLPQNIEIADISSKDAGLWKLAFSWAAPTNIGAGISKYAVFRSTDGTNFTQTATTSGLSYVDSSLSQVTYYYKVKACDSANNCGAFSDVVSKLPTGRFTTAPGLISNVGVEVSTRKASFSWVTDRISDSRVQYGVKSGDYFAGEVAVSAMLKTHSVDMDNLTAGTTYYYRVKWTDEDGNTGVSSEYTFSTLPAPIIKNVEIIKKTLSSATIKITTMDATKVSLFYGKSENFGGVTSVNTSRSESSYIIELTGLDDGSDYFFKLVTFDADGNQYDSHRIDAFSTPPRPRISNLRFQPVNGEPTSTQSVVWTTNIPASSTVTYGKVGTNGTDVYLSKATTEHEIILRGLEDDSQYFLMAQSRDADGNLAVSDRQTFKTALDTRPPKISDIRIETAVKGNGSEARGQIVVSWKTDEPATSQVAYAYGSAGSELPNKTGEDVQLSMDHVVIISDLTVSKVYHLVPISRDKSQNAGLGEDRSAVVGRATESVLNIILNSLKGIFGL